jgi:hypothetical protein
MKKALLLGLLVLLAGCTGTRAYQIEERPIVTIDNSQNPPVFHWTPNTAQVVRVYEGTPTGRFSQEGLMWVLRADSDNGLHSPITYGTVPKGGYNPKAARPLLAGSHYTVIVRRKDPNPRAEQSGLSDVLNRYEAREIFALTDDKAIP